MARREGNDMPSANLGTVLRQIHGLFEAGTVAGLTDGQLLDRYLADRDESAFAALVMRHGPMVLGVCHSILRRFARGRGRVPGDVPGPDPQGGHDPGPRRRRRLAASRRASGGRPGRRRSLADGPSASTGSGRPVRRSSPSESPLRTTIGASRCTRSSRGCPSGSASRSCSATWKARRTRRPPSSCDWSEATLRRRLADARDLLRSRLTRRGVAVSTGALAAAMASRGVGRGPARWVDALARAAPVVRATAGSAAAARLAGAVRSLLAGQVRTVANVVTMLVATSLVAGHLVPAGPARADDPARSTATAALRLPPHATRRCRATA